MREPHFDVFLCHNSEDKLTIIQIAHQLRQYGLKPWLDVWELQPGAIWQYSLEKQIESIRSAAVFVGHAGLGPWQSEEVLAFLQEFIRRGCPVIPVLLPNAPSRPALPIFLRNRHWVDFRIEDPDPLVQLVWGVTGHKPLPMVFPSSTPRLVQPIVQAIAEPIPDPIPVAPPPTPVAPPPKPVRPTIPPPPPDDLSSERFGSTYYTKLRNLLKAKDWKAADEETSRRMCEVMDRQTERWLRVEDFENFPCQDLKVIDRLWMKYSNNHFGFSVQKKLWEACDSPQEHNKNWEKFGETLGWRTRGLWGVGADWLAYSQLMFFELAAPQGHLPGVLWGVSGLLPIGWRWKETAALFSRLDTCQNS